MAIKLPHGVPRLVFINKMDKIGADFLYSVETLHEQLISKQLIQFNYQLVLKVSSQVTS